MATFARGHWTRQTHTTNEPLRKELRRQAPQATIQTSRGTVTYTYSASDWITLRGIPAIGRGVGGAIPGSNPEAAATR